MWVFASLCTDKWMPLDAQRCRCRSSAKRFGCLDLQRDVGTIICTEAWVFVSAKRCRCQSLHRDVDVSVCRELWMSVFAQLYHSLDTQKYCTCWYQGVALLLRLLLSYPGNKFTLHNFVLWSCKTIEQKCFIYHHMYHGD